MSKDMFEVPGSRLRELGEKARELVEARAELAERDATIARLTKLLSRLCKAMDDATKKNGRGAAAVGTTKLWKAFTDAQMALLPDQTVDKLIQVQAGINRSAALAEQPSPPEDERCCRCRGCTGVSVGCAFCATSVPEAAGDQ